MEYLQITTHEDYRVADIYKSYCETFPPDERRGEAQFEDLFSHQKVKVFSVLKDLEAVGYLVLWELTNFVFVEHFEIFSPFRSLKYGSEILRDLYRDYSHIVLEVEPEGTSEDAHRRVEFYRKNGFTIIDENYQQPCYTPDKNPLPLWLMANWQPEQPLHVKEEIYDVVYC